MRVEGNALVCNCILKAIIEMLGSIPLGTRKNGTSRM